MAVNYKPEPYVLIELPIRAIDLAGEVVGELLVVGPVERLRRSSGSTIINWLCVCSCGQEIVVTANNLRRGNTKSCGCLRKESVRVAHECNKTHGLAGSPTYRSWESMKQRCENPQATNYHRYGGRGISVCGDWKDSFQSFLNDMGERPSLAMSLDRIDNNAGYGPANCRWATRKEQANNRG